MKEAKGKKKNNWSSLGKQNKPHETEQRITGFYLSNVPP